MKNILNEELNQMKYLFGYKRGVVISEQNLQKSLEFINKFAKDVTLQKVEKLKSLQDKADDDIKAGYDPYIKYYTDLSQGIQATPPNKEFTDKFDASFSLNSNKPTTDNQSTSSTTTDKTKLNLPQLKSDVEKYEDSIMTTAPENIKSELNKDRDNRSVGVATSTDYNIAKSKAFIKGSKNLAKKFGVDEIKSKKVIDATQDGQTFVVVAKA
jgi:hypothetical protein